MGVMKLLGKGLLVIGMLTVLAVMGCSDRTAADQSTDADLPENLSAMQGEWVCACTNSGAVSCKVTIDGYTIRLRYQEEADSSVVRESAGIERIDESLQMFVLNGGSGAWPYLYGTSNGHEYLELEFFNRQQDEWKRLCLQRAEGTHG